MKRVPLILPSPRGPRIPASYRVRDSIETNDSLQNLVTGLGTSQDKSVGTNYVYSEMGKPQLEAAFRSDWIARKAISIPAQDATREWRTWDIDKKDNKKITTAERDLGLQRKVKNAMIKARLYGGAALLMGVDQGSMSAPLDLEKVGQDSLKFVHVVSKWELTAGTIDWDVASETYGQPEYYTRSGGDASQQIHPSRVIRFLGNEVPDLQVSNGWGDSVLQSVNDAVIAAGMTLAGGAQLVNEVKMDVIKIPQLTQALANKRYAALLTNRFALANVTKSLYNILLLDKAEEWERITANMTGIPDVLKMYLLVASASVDIPSTRFLSQSPSGLSATGDSDIRNWYDHVKSEQTTTQQPALRPLDEILIRSTLGTQNPDDIEYHWNPLWQMDEVQRSTIIGQKANAYKIDVDTGLIPSEILRDGRINQLQKDGVYPGLEQIVEDYGPLDPIIDNPEPGSVIGPDGQPIAPNDPTHPDNAPQLGPDGKPKLGPDGKPITVGAAKKPFGDMAARIRRANMRNKKYQHMDGVVRTLYVYRPVMNTKDILDWAKEEGIPNLVASNELHTTIMYSRTPIDWSKTGEDWMGGDENGNIKVKPGGMRVVQKFGNAIVLCFNSSNFGYRHCQIKENAGATWDYAEYQPHITLAYLDPEDGPFDVEDLDAYQGAIEFGPEVFAEATNPYVGDSAGNPYWGTWEDYNENHDPKSGQFSEGHGNSTAAAKGSKLASARSTVKELLTKRGAKEAVKKAANKIGKNKAAIANGAIQASLYHVAGIDYGPDIEKLIAHEIEHFAHNAGVGLTMAKGVMKDMAHGLRDWYKSIGKSLKFRGDAEPESDPVLQALDDLIKAIDAYEPPAEEE